jgi:molecular chaperone DnaK (HSP70)
VVRSKTDSTLVASEMIAEGSDLPAERTEDFSPIRPGQDRVVIQIVEAAGGASIEEGLLLGQTEFPIPPSDDSEGRIRIRLQVDRSNMIHAYILDRISGKKTEMEIDWKESRGDVA